jgi:hypothetical protein
MATTYTGNLHLGMQEDKTDLAGRMLSSEGISSARLPKDELIEILR